MSRILPARCATLLPVLLFACGDDGPSEPVDERPEVIAVSPTLTTGVGLLQDITVTFSEPMNPATLNATTVSIGPMPGGLHLAYNEGSRTLWIAPDSMYPAETALTLAIASGATDMAGNGLAPFSAGFTTGPHECAFLGDRFEPNDDISMPLQVEADSLVIGLSTCMDDLDFFRVTLSDTVMLTARTSFTYADSVSWGIYWLREDSEQYSSLGARAVTGGERTYGYTFLPGSYYVQIFGHHDEPLVLYDLVLESGDPCPDDEYEDNDFEDEAAAITPGTLAGLKGCHVDKDWFSFPVTAGQTITLTVDPGSYAGTRRLILREPGGNIAAETDGGSLRSITLTATADGTALAHTRYWADGVTYDMTIDVTG